MVIVNMKPGNNRSRIRAIDAGFLTYSKGIKLCKVATNESSIRKSTLRMTLPDPNRLGRDLPVAL
jgi:hypothetical protein